MESYERRPSINRRRSSRGRQSSHGSVSPDERPVSGGSSSRHRRRRSIRRRTSARRHHRGSYRDDDFNDGSGSSFSSEGDNEERDELGSIPEDLSEEDEEEAEEGTRRSRKFKRRLSFRRSQEGDRSSLGSVEVTLKDRQEAMNKEHPFGMPIWKPALYKKSRSIVRRANDALHSKPMSAFNLMYSPGNALWTLLFGWWLAVTIAAVSVIVLLIPPKGRLYSRMLRELAIYLLWPFGCFVQRMSSADSEYQPLLTTEALEEGGQPLITKRRHRTWRDLFTQIFRSGPTGWVYYFLYFTVIGPLLLLVSSICWMCVITIPMAKLNYRLLRHLRRYPLELHFRYTDSSSQLNDTNILLCTYQAIGLQYYKYTYDGINIIFINLLSLVFFVFLDEYVIRHYFPDSFITSPFAIFALALLSVIPLSYFIGMGVSSVSAQTSMAVGAVINATFGSIIEIILYAIALMGGKSSLVEGCLIGSILVGVLLLPGASMVSGGIKRKEQRFNAKSAGVTSTMLIMAIIGALSPTLFYQMFGSFQLKCTDCPDPTDPAMAIACSQCHYDQMNPADDPVYQNSVKPFTWFCALILPSAYIIGLVFSLHTHVDMVWKKPDPPAERNHQNGAHTTQYQSFQPYYPPGQEPAAGPGILKGDTYRKMATSDPSMNASSTTTPPQQHPPLYIVQTNHSTVNDDEKDDEEEEEVVGHDSPNWSKAKSFTVLFACTLLFSIIAEILVATVDLIMADLALDEKFLGLTLFSLVPNITEFTNAMAFSMHGNIVLSMEIGSAYALQVCLLQIPAMVAFSLWYNWGAPEVARYTFSLIFPRWDVIAVIFAVFLLNYVYQEGKSNYFKGSILILSYCVLLAGFFFIPPLAEHSVLVFPTVSSSRTLLK